MEPFFVILDLAATRAPSGNVLLHLLIEYADGRTESRELILTLEQFLDLEERRAQHNNGEWRIIPLITH